MQIAFKVKDRIIDPLVILRGVAKALPGIEHPEHVNPHGEHLPCLGVNVYRAALTLKADALLLAVLSLLRGEDGAGRRGLTLLGHRGLP